MTTESPSARAATDLLGFKQITMKLALEWMPHLSASEITLALWLIGNTLGRGRSKGNYTLDQMVNGQQKADGSGMWMAGSGLSRPTVHRTIQSLAEKNLITTVRTGRGLDITVNPRWSPLPGAEQDTNIVAFPGTPTRRPPKKPSLASRIAAENDTDDDGFSPQDDQIDHEPMIKMITQNDQIDHTTKDRNKGWNNDQRVTGSPAATGASLGAVSESPNDPREAARLRMAQRAAARSKLAAPAPGQITTATVEQVWRSAHREAFPTVQPVAWSQRDRAMLKAVMKKFDPAQFVEFTGWVVANWSHAVETYCGWMKTKPPAPHLGFLLGRHRELFLAWTNREQEKYRGTLPRAERQIADLMAKGMTRDAAILEAAKLAALAEDQQARDAELAAAASALRTAKAMQADAEAKMRRDAAELGRRARQRKTEVKDFSTGTYDVDKGAALEPLPTIDPEAFAK